MSDTDIKEPEWGTLAKQLRVSRTAIFNWKKLPGAPEEANFEAWRDFVAAEGLGISGNRVGKKRETLLEGRAEKQNRLLDLQIAKEERKYVERAEVNKLLLAVSSRQKAQLYAALEREYPGKVVGRTVSEISVLGRELADRLCEIFQQPVEQWQTSE